MSPDPLPRERGGSGHKTRELGSSSLTSHTPFPKELRDVAQEFNLLALVS